MTDYYIDLVNTDPEQYEGLLISVGTRVVIKIDKQEFELLLMRIGYDLACATEYCQYGNKEYSPDLQALIASFYDR